ncbi:MAG TPA: hypothetical protein VMS21_13815, partial [Methylomirabilota bacterium]|nr:hypothetical protein [Methylomirabilota bacterium]
TVMTGHLYDHLDLTAPVATLTVDGTEDDRVLTHPEGVFGLFVFSRDDATGANSIGDATFDNFFVASPALVTLPGPGIAHPVPGTPQVVNRTPMSHAAFHPATEGIAFAALAPGGAAVDASNVRLFLNGNDVTGDLDFTPTALGVEVSLDTLEENRVYQARIIVSDGATISTTNEFVFDTFTQAFLDSAGVMVIEAEDYNYGNGVCEPPTAVPPTSGGLYQNNPPPSGFINNQRVPEDGTGYLDKFGLIEVDYSDATGQAGGSSDSYRICDSVDTAPGGLEIEPGPIVNDVERAKYALAGVPDYQVIDTEAGEWLNYTRDFVGGDYHVFLRVASTAAQEVFLDRVSGDTTSNQQTTTRLGTFEVPNTHLRIRYQHVPLTDESGNPVVVNFPGTDTVRLTVGGEPGTFETERTMALNYLVFVPATTLPPLPPILEQPAREGSNFQFSFMAAAGSSYRVQSTPSLEDPQWADLQTIDGGGAMETFSQAIEGDARYFRVILE